MGDPVEDGLAASLARPGGNVTGLTFLGPELVLKRLELLKQMLPTVSRAAALWHRDVLGERRMKEVQSEAAAAARTMGVQLQLVEIRGSGELDGAFSAIAREHADALVVLPSGVLYAEQRRIVDLAARHRLPTMYSVREWVANGGLVSYGSSLADLQRRSATYVDRILKGAKPGDLPIEQPTKFELVINLKTAKALGITVPQSLLVRADEVIQ
jgi:putative ABC transport system substrate-binding protein